MRAYEKFLKYVQVYTESDPSQAKRNPSTDRQFDLAHQLAEEMRQIGFEKVVVDEHCYVYGWISASPGCEHAPPLGLIAHMDTAPSASGKDVKPLQHPQYDGNDVVLPNGHVIPVAVFPELAKLKGETLITASGGTLLGADDKAGIAEILTACEEILQNSLPHGPLCIAFTPDEEIGAGADCFDVSGFGADFAYTVDGGDVGEIEYETFNAASAKLVFTGVNVHPGSAKGIMVNAAALAIEYHSMLPQGEVPEKTGEREGFYHLVSMSGKTEAAKLEYIVRDHDRAIFESRKQAMRLAAEAMQKQYGEGAVQLTISDQYYNMGEVVEKHFHLVENARSAIQKEGIAPETKAVRGGTDGSRLSFMGLPCPNLGTGGFYYHGPNECITAERMDRAVRVLINIVEIYASAKREDFVS